MNTSTTGLTEGPTAAQETTGAAGDANNGRDTKTDGHIGIRREINKSRDATAGTLGRLTAERTSKRKGWQQSKGQLGHQGKPRTGTKEPVGAKLREGILTIVVTSPTAGTATTEGRQQQQGSQHHKGRQSRHQQQGPLAVFETWETVNVNSRRVGGNSLDFSQSINSSMNNSITGRQQQQRPSQQLGLQEANGSKNVGHSRVSTKSEFSRIIMGR
jgi:hypothetical protein